MDKEVSKESVSLSDQIDSLEDNLAKLPLLEFVTGHIFKGGMYTRSLFIPKGTILTGRRHKTEHINIITQGSCSVATEDREGEETKIEATAPCIFSSKAGVRKVVYAYEDVMWTTVHICKATNAEDALKELTEDIRPSTLSTAREVARLTTNK